MKKRMLGATGLHVSEMGLGGLALASGGQGDERVKRTIGRALQLGINYIDTAAMYFDSEETIGRIIADVNEPVILSTKVGGRPQPFLPQDRDCLLRSIEDSFRFLQRDYIEVLMIHEPDRPRLFDWWTDPLEMYGPVLDCLLDLKKQGRIGYIGLGGTTAYEIVRVMRTGQFDVVLTAFNYSLLWREAELDLLPEAKRLHMGVIVGSPLQQGALARRYDEQVLHGAPWLNPPRRKQLRALYDFLDETGIALPELCLRFVLSNPNVSCVLTGARTAEEVEQNVAAVRKGPLDRETLAVLDDIAGMVPFRPYEEPIHFPFEREYKGPGVAWT